MTRLIEWFRARRPPRPPDTSMAKYEHARTRHSAFSTSERLLSELNTLESAAEEIRQQRTRGRRR